MRRWERWAGAEAAASSARHAPTPPLPTAARRSTHPSDRGHQMMAEALAGPLARAVAEQAAAAAGSLQRSRRRDERLEGMPPPMIPGNTESPTTVCAMQVRCRGG